MNLPDQADIAHYRLIAVAVLSLLAGGLMMHGCDVALYQDPIEDAGGAP